MCVCRVSKMPLGIFGYTRNTVFLHICTPICAVLMPPSLFLPLFLAASRLPLRPLPAHLPNRKAIRCKTINLMVKTFYNAINKITLTQVAVKIFNPVTHPARRIDCVRPYNNITISAPFNWLNKIFSNWWRCGDGRGSVTHSRGKNKIPPRLFQFLPSFLLPCPPKNREKKT